MKKITIAAIILMSTGILFTSCIKHIDISAQLTYHVSKITDMKDVGSAD